MDVEDNPKLHMVLVPLVAQGHMIPMADLALLLAARGATVSLITTPVNACRLRATADVAAASGLSLRLVELPFTPADTGLPDGCENADLLPGPDLFRLFFDSLSSLADPLRLYLRHHPPAPTCIIADQCMPWTMEVSADLGIPRLVFHGPSCFFLLCTLNIAIHRAGEAANDDLEPFPVPELPQRIEVCRMESKSFFDWPGWQDFLRHVEEADSAADGVVLNTFQELEPWCIDLYRTAVGKPVWPIGPVSLCHMDGRGMAGRGNPSPGADHSDVIRWLDGREPGSVLFVSFGSLARSRLRQLVEIGGGLEAAGRAFVWAFKEAEKSCEVETWLAGFRGKNSGSGLLIRGWVPQVLILSHPSMGGFMTHCGWNSTLEAVAAGVPMATWPHFADQFLNEKLVVEVLKTGVPVGGKRIPTFYQMIDGEVAMVRKEEVERAVEAVMGGGEEGEERRKRARSFGEKARQAMEEGGSSHHNLGLLISRAIQLASSSDAAAVGNGE